MKIRLSKNIPAQDGYYLMQFNAIGGLHLVLLQTELDGTRIMQPDDPKHYTSMRLDSAHANVLQDALFSQEAIIIE